MMTAITLSWEQVAVRHRDQVLGFAYRLTRNHHDAEDLVQDVLLRVGRAIGSFQPGSMDGWLWRITRNAFLDEVRRRGRRPTLPLPDSFEGISTRGLPEPELDGRIGGEVEDALQRLPRTFREVVVLCDVAGFTYQEIADRLGIPVGTVRSRLHRGRQALRDALRK